MTTLATNFLSCSAVKVNVCVGSDCSRVFCLSTEAYDFWLLTHMLSERLFFVFGTPLYEAICGPLQFAQVGFLNSLLGHPLIM